jgi:D-alanyl-D-alanine carboxypeptidase
MKKGNIIIRKRMYPVIVVMIVAVMISSLCLRSDIRFIVKNAWNQYYLSAELEKVNFSKNIIKSVPLLDIKEGKTDIAYNNTLCLVNAGHPIGEEWPFKLVDYKDTGVFMDEPLVESYAELSADVKKHTGNNLFVMSHYRNGQEQKHLYEEDNNTAALPGASEHQTGLALDIYVNGFAGSGFLKSEAGQYVNKYSWKYGFIIRYPLFKKHITGIRFEPWHIRFVGLPHSEIIYKEGLTLEEYISSLEVGDYYKYKNYYISRQEGSKLLIPCNLKESMVSPDNTGCYIITGVIV